MPEDIYVRDRALYTQAFNGFVDSLIARCKKAFDLVNDPWEDYSDDVSDEIEAIMQALEAVRMDEE